MGNGSDFDRCVISTKPKRAGHVDGPYLAAVATQRPYLEHAAEVVALAKGIHPLNAEVLPLAGEKTATLKAIVQRVNESTWAWSTADTPDLPIWVARVIQETICSDPDLRVYPDPDDPTSPEKATLYRRLMPGSLLRTAPPLWVPVGNLMASYGGHGARDQVWDFENVIKQAMLNVGQTIVRGCSFRCTNGEYRYYYDRARRSWTEILPKPGNLEGYATRIGANSRACRRPDFQPIALENLKCDWDRADDMDKPMTYAVDMDMTTSQLEALAVDVDRLLDEWTKAGGPDSAWNLKRSFASMFLRSHPEIAYVYQGPGGSGKSTLAKDLLNHLHGQGMTLSLDLLTQPTAMSAENAMGSLASHLLALSDDYDPRGGRFQKILPPLKTLLTGLLPFSARRQGENSFDATPQAVHLITTNSRLPIGDSTAEQRRFAFATIKDAPDHRLLDEYRDLTDEYGFAPFMFVSARAWLRAGDMPCQRAAYVELSDFSDTEVDMLREAAETGYATPIPGVRVAWNALGLKRSSRRVGGQVETCYRPYREDENPQLHGVWLSAKSALGIEENPASSTPPIPDEPVADTPDEWAAMIERAGGMPRMFPCHDHDGDGHSAKSPDADRLHHMTGEWSWKKAAADPALAARMSRPTDPSVHCWGMTVSDRFVWFDLDAHGTGETGWQRLNGEVGAYGSEALPRTFMVRTPSGGVHLLYRIPDGLRLKNRANGSAQVDLRVGGLGYVVSGGSRTSSGVYQPVDTPAGADVPVLSARLVDWLQANGYVEPDEGSDPSDGSTGPAPSTPPSPRPRPHPRQGGGRPDMTPIAEGTRNDTLYRWGFGRWTHYPQERPRIEREIMERGRKSGLSEREIRSIITSIHRGKR